MIETWHSAGLKVGPQQMSLAFPHLPWRAKTPETEGSRLKPRAGGGRGRGRAYLSAYHSVFVDEPEVSDPTSAPQSCDCHLSVPRSQEA